MKTMIMEKQRDQSSFWLFSKFVRSNNPSIKYYHDFTLILSLGFFYLAQFCQSAVLNYSFHESTVLNL